MEQLLKFDCASHKLFCILVEGVGRHVRFFMQYAASMVCRFAHLSAHQASARMNRNLIRSEFCSDAASTLSF